MMWIPVAIHTADDGGNVITLLEPLAIEWEGRQFTIPAGFKSDGASVPEFLWDDVSPAIDSRTIRGALAHDYIYREQPEGWTRADADSMFYDLIREDGLGWWKSQKAYWGLRLFGGAAWRKNQKIKEAAEGAKQNAE